MKKIFISIAILCIILILLPSVSMAVSAFKNIDVNNLNMNSIDPGKVDDLKSAFENISKKDFSSSAILERCR